MSTAPSSWSSTSTCDLARLTDVPTGPPLLNFGPPLLDESWKTGSDELRRTACSNFSHGQLSPSVHAPLRWPPTSAPCELTRFGIEFRFHSESRRVPRKLARLSRLAVGCAPKPHRLQRTTALDRDDPCCVPRCTTSRLPRAHAPKTKIWGASSAQAAIGAHDNYHDHVMSLSRRECVGSDCSKLYG